MFLHVLNDAQQRAFLTLAQRFIEADDHLAAEETNLLELMWADAGLSFDDTLPSNPTEELLPLFDTRQARAAALLELIAAGHADDEFHPEENAFIRQLAAAWDVSEAELARYESWVQRQLALAQEAESFWN